MRAQCDYFRNELEHKTNYANSLEKILKKQDSNTADQTDTQEQITEPTDKQNDEVTVKVCFHTCM